MYTARYETTTECMAKFSVTNYSHDVHHVQIRPAFGTMTSCCLGPAATSPSIAPYSTQEKHLSFTLNSAISHTSTNDDFVSVYYVHFSVSKESGRRQSSIQGSHSPPTILEVPVNRLTYGGTLSYVRLLVRRRLQPAHARDALLLVPPYRSFLASLQFERPSRPCCRAICGTREPCRKPCPSFQLADRTGHW